MKKVKICVIGQGYVGLELSTAFGKHYSTIGFDINKKRIDNLNEFKDTNKQFSQNNLKASKVFFTYDIADILRSNIFIICVPTPVNNKNQPDISNIKKATITVSKILKKNDLIIYESTVYPGLTEEYCIKVIEKYSKLKVDRNFNIGYSPERINPGDKIRTISKIKKIISARNNETLNLMNKIYGKIVKAGLYKAENIKTAEAAKVIENAQRDINIAFVNELSIIFDRMNINTNSVLKAASTKWNFLNFKPGLVGGHCIGIDPYYLTYQSKKFGYNPKIILAGRNINERMHKHIIEKIYKYKTEKKLKKLTCTIMGVTFKENCPDSRNSQSLKMLNLIKKDMDIELQVHDPVVNKKELENQNKIILKDFSNITKSDVLVISVSHHNFQKINTTKWLSIIKKNSFIIDIKSLIDANKFKKFKRIKIYQL